MPDRSLAERAKVTIRARSADNPNRLIGTIIFLVACFFIAMLLASFVLMLRSPSRRDEGKPWFTFIWVYLLVLAAPYIYCEVLTRKYGPLMDSSIQAAYKSASFSGPMRYYRLTGFKGTSATAIVIGNDNQSWGGNENPVIKVTLELKNDGKWKAESFKVMSSGRLNQDNFVFPPFY